jgi:hypothetical protein
VGKQTATKDLQEQQHKKGVTSTCKLSTPCTTTKRRRKKTPIQEPTKEINIVNYVLFISK